ncbi:MAG: nuclear transport factor 2 family protein [Gammaproteobacteria bacterium]
MTGIKTKSTRRAFFASGGAVLGAGVATTVAASALSSEKPAPTNEQLKQLRQQLAGVQDREAIRQLHVAFTTLVEARRFEPRQRLFDEQAHLQLSSLSAAGKPAIRKLFANQYREQALLRYTAHTGRAPRSRETR